MAENFGGQQDWEGYDAKMCQVGRVLLAEEMHRITQKIPALFLAGLKEGGREPKAATINLLSSGPAGGRAVA